MVDTKSDALGVNHNLEPVSLMRRSVEKFYKRRTDKEIYKEVLKGISEKYPGVLEIRGDTGGFNYHIVTAALNDGRSNRAIIFTEYNILDIMATNALYGNLKNVSKMVQAYTEKPNSTKWASAEPGEFDIVNVPDGEKVAIREMDLINNETDRSILKTALKIRSKEIEKNRKRPDTKSMAEEILKDL
jgi:hypothetical protein